MTLWLRTQYKRYYENGGNNMNVNTKKKNAINNKEEAKIIAVKRAKEFDWGISFDMIVNDVTIYGCKLIQKKNSDELFVAFPSRKGTDDKYYNDAYVDLSDEDTQNIVAQIEKM